MSTVAKWCSLEAIALGAFAHAADQGASAGPPVVSVRCDRDPSKSRITFLSWDTEGGPQAKINLLRPNEGNYHGSGLRT
jgi:hypothetical protein